MNGRFADSIVLITGATSGIGEACANLFALEGASLMLTGRDEPRGHLIRDRLNAAGTQVRFSAGDIQDRSYCDEIVAHTVREFGRLDVLINSAGIWQPAAAVETTDDLWHETLATNLNGSFFTARAALRQMLKQGSGNIINIASDLALVGGRQAVAYCASKGAVVMMTKAMALDHARDNIRVNALCPTDTDTPMMHRDYVDQGLQIATGLKNSAAANPMGRVASPEDVAEAACFIASAAAGFIPGVTLSVDGAATAD
ncbi:MAG: SDR family oxidoreductase [Gammaproteobacteria bacterium]|nr:SDR family oxidoreductase [Gammaproteobacteria bacterium]MBT6244394.1 SDR family oxidoreductase [Gammaproteobacteria bacterium]